MAESARMAIGSLARETGTNIETIRYYADPESRRVSPLWQRSREALNFVRRARNLGFSIGEIRTLLRLADERSRPCAEVRMVAEAHLTEVRGKIADLRRMELVLKETIARCAAGRRSRCAVIEALYRNGSPKEEPDGDRATTRTP